MALVSAQYSDSEGEMSGGGSHRSDDEDDFDGENANPALPFRMTLQEPHGGVSGGSSGQNTPPPPPRGGRAPSGSPDVISASLLGSRQPSPKSGTDSPLLRVAPRGGGSGGGGGSRGPASKLAEPSQGLSGLVGYRGDDDEDDEDEDGNESKAHRRRSAEDAEDEGSQGLVPDYMDISTASFMFDKTLPSSQNADASAGFVASATVPTAGGGGSNSGNSVIDGVVQIPPEPPGRCSKQLQENIAEKYERYLRDGIDYNRAIQRKKDFKNPSIYEKLIEISGISEFGTNYSRDIYDPLLWGPESNYEELAKAQKVEMDKREEKRKGGDVRTSKVEFVSGTAKKTASASNTNVVVSEGEGKEKKRKSKWDQGTADGSAPPPPVGVASSTSLSDGPAPSVSASSTVLTQATGTKATVIPAVGGLLTTKKPKA